MSDRYSRHHRLAEVGVRGQEQLERAAVRVAGDGPAAEEAALYLCAAGVGRLVLEPGLASLVPRLAELNPEVRVVPSALDARPISPDDPGRRADGARAALLALVELSGAAPARPWQEVPWKP